MSDINKTLVLAAFETLFNRRDYEATSANSVSGLPMFGVAFPTSL